MNSTMGKGKPLEVVITGTEINHGTKKNFNKKNSQFKWKSFILFKKKKGGGGRRLGRIVFMRKRCNNEHKNSL